MPSLLRPTLDPYSCMPDPHTEARLLLAMVLRGSDTPAKVRDLIDVPDSIVSKWQRIPNPLTRAHVLGVLAYRKQVLRIFNEMLWQAQRAPTMQ